ncbi:MAG: hypothetical protein ACREKS_20695 [Candidatus Rokuibacteriota bacterium]
MHVMMALIALGIVLAVGGCASEEKEWMKIGASYTMAEFRRDYTACSKGGTLDETCMRSKGWVDVNPGQAGKTVVEPQRPGPPGGIGPASRQP